MSPELAALEAKAAQSAKAPHRAKHQPELRPPSELHTSQRGKEFIFKKESANPEITQRTHWPGWESGVT